MEPFWALARNKYGNLVTMLKNHRIEEIEIDTPSILSVVATRDETEEIVRIVNYYGSPYTKDMNVRELAVLNQKTRLPTAILGDYNME